MAPTWSLDSTVSAKACSVAREGISLSPLDTNQWPLRVEYVDAELQSQLLPALAQRSQTERVKFDKSRRVAVVVGDRSLLKSHEILVVERVVALAANNDHVALVELEPHPTGDVVLAIVDRRLQHLALGCEPETVVDQLGIFRHQFVLEVRGTPVERDRFDGAMGCKQDSAAGRLIHPARLDADEPILHHIEPPDAVDPAKLIEARQQCRGRHLLAVDCNRIAFV